MKLTYKDLEAELDINSFEFYPIIEGKIISKSKRNNNYVDKLNDDDNRKKKNCLDRLVINVANLCNLDCVYCYAQGGDYGGPQEKMSLQTGINTFNKFFDVYNEIKYIQFFGGEPLLNWNIITKLSEYCWQLADKLGRKRPTLGFVTNGTILNGDIIEMIRKYDMDVTVSLDGPPEINNLLRISRQKMPNNLVEDNIKHLKKETGQPTQIEGTYTRLHIEKRCSVTDVMNYISKELGVGLLHMPINVLEDNYNMEKFSVKSESFGWIQQCYSDAVSKSIHSLLYDSLDNMTVLSSALDIIDILLKPDKKGKEFICPAGSGTIAVDSNGDIYPCFMFYRHRDFNMGSVNFINNAMDETVRKEFLSDLRPTTIPKLNKSWASRFLNGCAGGNFFKNGRHGIVSEKEILLIESMAQTAIVELSHLSIIKEKWEYLPISLNLFMLYNHAIPL